MIQTLILLMSILSISGSIQALAGQNGYKAGSYHDNVASNPCGCPACMINTPTYAENCHKSQASQKVLDQRTQAVGTSSKALRGIEESP